MYVPIRPEHKICGVSHQTNADVLSGQMTYVCKQGLESFEFVGFPSSCQLGKYE